MRAVHDHPEKRSGRTFTLSLGDALVLAVTARLGSDVVTADRHWSWLAGQDLLPVAVRAL